jgi:hypothetical protein
VAALLLLAVPAAIGCGDDDEPAAGRTETARTEQTTVPETDTATETTETAETETESEADSEDLPNTCELLNADEVRQATGRDVDPMEEKGESVDGFGYRQCNWTAVGFEDSAAVRVVSGTERYDTLKRDLGGAGARITNVSGLGDGAFFSSGFSGESAAGSRGSTLFVKSGGKTFSLALANAQDEGPQEELESLMRKMLERSR